MIKAIKRFLIHPAKRRLAKFYLVFLKNIFGLKVIGITGSAGKTTTKEMLASILKLKGKTVWTHANIDPIYNIPTTILKCGPLTQYLILEMGIEYPNEMDFYLWLAKPDIGVITNIFPTHTEFLKNQKGVLAEKSKLVLGRKGSEVAVLNSADSLLQSLGKKLKTKVIWFNGRSGPLVANANAAKAVAKYLGVGIKVISEGIKRYKRPDHRLKLFKHRSGAVILDDSYNSNPQATLTTLKYFYGLAGKAAKIGVLGDMLELGDYEEEGHRLVGQEVARQKFKTVIGVGSASKYLLDEVGKNSRSAQTFWAQDADAALLILEPLLKQNVFVLIKASRAIGLDRLVSKLQ